MKKRKIALGISILMVIAILVTACGKKADKYVSYDTAAPEYTTNSSVKYTSKSNAGYGETPMVSSFEVEYGDAGTEGTKQEEASGIGTEASLDSQNNFTDIKDKIIRRFTLEVETLEFDTLIEKLDSEIKRLGGYIETSRISGKSYHYSYESRYGNIVARIPKDKVDEFINSVNVNANVIDKQETTENVTLRYVDIQNRKKALEIEQERLFELLEKTDTLDNIIALESRLSEIRYELQNYTTELRTIDNEVDYSTVNMNIHEVQRITPVTEIKQTVGERIKNGLSDSLYDISEGFKNFFVGLIVNLPYLIIWGVIITILVLVVRRIVRRSRMANRLKQAALGTGQTDTQKPLYQTIKQPEQEKQNEDKEQK